MKILQVTRQFYPAVGGIETVVLELSRALIALGHEVQVATLDRLWGQKTRLEPEELLEGIRIHRIPFWGTRHYAVAPNVIGQVKKCDLVHLHSSDFFLDYLAFTKLFHKRPVILSTHGIYFHTPFLRDFKEIYFRTFTKLALRQIEAIICDSQQDSDRIREIAPPSKLRIISNGVYFPPDINKSKDHNLILSTGRLFQNKRFDRLISTFALLVQARPELKLVIIGEDQGEKLNLEKQIAILGLQNRVILLGQVDEQKKWEYLSQAYIWVLASEYESFGVALVEAMAAGCIPVVSDLPAFHHFINHSTNGFLLNYSEPRETANRINELLNLPEEQKNRISDLAREKASEFAWDVIVKDFEQLYKEVVCKKF